MKKLIPYGLLAALFVTPTVFAGDMADMKMGDTEAAAVQSAQTTGVVNAIDAAKGKVTITHEPVPSLNWPAMKMGFKIKPELSSNLVVGQKIDFDFVMEGRTAVITKIVAAK